MLLTIVFFGEWLSRLQLMRLRHISLATLPRYGRRGGRRGGFINVNDMYNNNGQGDAQGCEAYEVK